MVTLIEPTKGQEMAIVNGLLATAAVEKHMDEMVWNWHESCDHCGEPFLSLSAAARYCCAAHKQAAYRERVKERNAALRFVAARRNNNA